MKQYIASCIVVAQMVLAGCASVPPQPPHAATQEPALNKAVIAQHWGAIAADVAAQTKQHLADTNFLTDRSLSVMAASNSPFDQAFSNFIITGLVAAGVPVATHAEGAVELRYETQLIRHHPGSDARSSAGAPSIELLITTSIIDGDQYLQRSTHSYDIEKADADLFEARMIEAKPRLMREWTVESK